MSTLNLQLVSLEFCRLCRSVPSLLVRVEVSTPRRLCSPEDARETFHRSITLGVRARGPEPPRVPPLQQLGVRWMIPGVAPTQMPAAAQLSGGVSVLRLVIARGKQRVLSAAREVMGGVRMQVVSWPASLRYLHLDINQPITEIDWPTSLQQLSFGTWFNQPIAGVMWPASLQQLSFGANFNQSITRVVWPAFLLQLSFGVWFNQPVAGVVWPASLQQLTTCGRRP